MLSYFLYSSFCNTVCCAYLSPLKHLFWNSIKALTFLKLLIKSFTLYCQCKLLFFSSTLHLYFLYHFFRKKATFKATFQKIESLFICVCARVLSWMYQKSSQLGLTWIKNILLKRDPVFPQMGYHLVGMIFIFI